MTEIFNDDKYVVENNGEILLTIEKLNKKTYHAKNKFIDITAEIMLINEYEVQTNCIEYKRVGKDGKFRKTEKLIDYYMHWLVYMLKAKGFISKRKPFDYL